MIRISIGNVGSGKTASEVRELLKNPANRTTYTNIKTSVKNTKIIDASMIIKKDIVDYKKKKNEELEPVYDYKLNLDFWKQAEKPINIVLDEAHSIINSRRSMSKINIIVTDWLALIRRILGEDSSGIGELVFITQLPQRIDVIAREMAHQVRYHVCHYVKLCSKCGSEWQESSDMAEILWQCPSCGSFSIKKHSHKVEIFFFQGMSAYEAWRNFGMNTYWKRIFINDIEKIFKKYDTFQWDNLFSEYY